jgi:hypothetical protein
LFSGEENTMKTRMLIGSCFLFGALAACSDGLRRADFPDADESDARSASTALAEARKAEAEVYAPALYRAAEEASKGEAANASKAEVHGSESTAVLAARAMDEAIRTRIEAREAARRSIRDAGILLSVVESLVDDPAANRQALPSASRLEALKGDLARASTAFEKGDYAAAGLAAQEVYSDLSPQTARTLSGSDRPADGTGDSE